MLIIGTKSLAKELFSALMWDNYEKDKLFFFDNVNAGIPDKLFGEFPIIKSWDKLNLHFKKYGYDYLIGVGNPRIKYILVKKLEKLGGILNSFISEKALLGKYGNTISEGACILPNTIITCDVTIGKCTLVNKAVVISHDVQIGEYCSISPGAKIMSRTKIGNFTEIGTGAITLPGANIGNNCIVGAGAVVKSNFPDNSVIVGVPAKIIKIKKENLNG